MFFLSLFIIGTAFWSFSTVLIERWKSNKWGILLWRSECPKCHHILTWKELFPIFSYVFQQGKCRSCKTKISWFYPLAEILMWVIFLIIGNVFINGIGDFFWIQMFILFILWFITWVYILYDFRYMEIPDQVMIPWIYLYLILVVWYLFFPNWGNYIFDSYTYHSAKEFVLDHVYAAILLYSFFYIQILVPWGIFLIKTWQYWKLRELFLSYFLFPITLPFSHFLKKEEPNEIEDEIPAWVWWWDLRIALFIWLTLGLIHWIAAFFIAYCLGSIVGILYLIKYRKRGNTQIPFWPFLGIGWITVIYFHSEILIYVIDSIKI